MTNGDTQASNLSQPATFDPGVELLRWRSHPVRHGGKRLVGVLSVLAGLPLLLTALYGTFYGTLAVLILGGSLASYFLPTDYVLYSGGGEIRFLGVTRRFTWSQFRSFYPDSNGILISPFAGPSRLENFRGIYLRSGEVGDLLKDIVAAQLSTTPAVGEVPVDPGVGR